MTENVHKIAGHTVKRLFWHEGGRKKQFAVVGFSGLGAFCDAFASLHTLTPTQHMQGKKMWVRTVCYEFNMLYHCKKV